jgi:uncharacterized membrane protein
MLHEFLDALPPRLAVFLLAMTPIIELRGAVPLGILVYKLPVLDVVFFSFLGNLLPVPFLFATMQPGERLMRRIGFMDRFLTWLFARTRRKTSRHIERYQELALIALVAVPLPGTGAWTGVLVAYLFGLPVRMSFVSIAVGVLLAAIFVAALVKAGVGLWALGSV